MSAPPVELAFASILADNDKVVRDRAVKKLTKWLAGAGGQQSAADMLKLWKGLFYCYWMSDKPLVQQELAAKLGGLVSVFSSHGAALRFVSAFFTTIIREWPGIDRLRMDKFYNLVLEMLAAVFRRLRAAAWSPDAAAAVAAMLARGPLNVADDTLPMGIPLHLVEHLMPRLIAAAPAGRNPLPTPAAIAALLQPVWTALTAFRGRPLFDRVSDGVFAPLFEAPHLTVDWAAIAQTLFELATSTDSSVTNREQLHALRRRLLAAANLDDPLMPSRKRKEEEPAVVPEEKEETVAPAPAKKAKKAVVVPEAVAAPVVAPVALAEPVAKKGKKPVVAGATEPAPIAPASEPIAAKKAKADAAVVAAEPVMKKAKKAASVVTEAAPVVAEPPVVAKKAKTAVAPAVVAVETVAKKAEVAAEEPVVAKKAKKAAVEQTVSVSTAKTATPTAAEPAVAKKSKKVAVADAVPAAAAAAAAVITTPAKDVKKAAVVASSPPAPAATAPPPPTPKSLLRLRKTGSGEASTPSSADRRVSWGVNEHKPFLKATPPAAVALTAVRRARK